MRKPAEPTESELCLLRLVWQNGSVSVDFVHRILTKTEDITYNTVQSRLNSMVHRGFLVRARQGRAFIYSARVGAMETEKSLTRNLISRLFAGSAKSLVLGLMKQGELTAAELRDLAAEAEGSSAATLRKRKPRGEKS